MPNKGGRAWTVWLGEKEGVVFFRGVDTPMHTIPEVFSKKGVDLFTTNFI